VFCFDGDAAGRKAAWRALEVSVPLAPDNKPIRFLFLPEGEDPDSYIRGRGNEAFERLVREAQTLTGFLLAELRAQTDLSTPEGRSRFVSAAKPHLQRLAAAGLRLQLVKEVADLARVSQEEAERLMELRSAPSYIRPAPQRASAPLPLSLEWKLLARAFACPALVLEIDPALLSPELPESQALLELMDLLKGVEDVARLSDSVLAELIDKAAHGSLLSRAQAVLNFELRLGEEEAVSEFREFLEALRRREPEADRSLRQRVLKGVATPEERRRFEEKMLAPPRNRP
jgi:DNA primase